MSAERILIVEDEAIVALDLCNQLEDLGYQVVGTADCSERALQLATDHQPDLVLMDVMLKGALDGIEIAKAIQRMRDTPVIFLTSFSNTETVKRAAQAGPYGYLSKPFQLSELAAGIEVALYKARMERQLRESERWFAATLRCVDEGVIVTEPDTTIRYMNKAAEQLTGWPLAQAQGQALDQIVRFAPSPGKPAEHRGSLALRRAMDSGRTHHARKVRALVSRTGWTSPVDQSASPVLNQQGECIGAVLVLRDVRERLRQEARMRASEASFRGAFDAAPIGMAIQLLDGSFSNVNQALCRMLGRDRAELLRLGHQAISHADDWREEQLRLAEWCATLPATESLEAPPSLSYDKRYLHADGQIRWARVSLSRIPGVANEVSWLFHIHDITLQREAAQQLAQRPPLARVGEPALSAH